MPMMYELFVELPGPVGRQTEKENYGSPTYRNHLRLCLHQTAPPSLNGLAVFIFAGYCAAVSQFCFEVVT